MGRLVAKEKRDRWEGVFGVGTCYSNTRLAKTLGKARPAQADIERKAWPGAPTQAAESHVTFPSTGHPRASRGGSFAVAEKLGEAEHAVSSPALLLPPCHPAAHPATGQPTPPG